jgi:Putative peptidoglycan binding domain
VGTTSNIFAVSGFAALTAFFIYAESPATQNSDDPFYAIGSDPASGGVPEVLMSIKAMLPLYPADAESQSRQKPPKSLVFHVQVLLKQQGYDPGPIDGIVGAKTKLSRETFRSSANLPPDGLVTKELLQQLEATENDKRIASEKP